VLHKVLYVHELILQQRTVELHQRANNRSYPVQRENVTNRQTSVSTGSCK